MEKGTHGEAAPEGLDRRWLDDTELLQAATAEMLTVLDSDAAVHQAGTRTYSLGWRYPDIAWSPPCWAYRPLSEQGLASVYRLLQEALKLYGHSLDQGAPRLNVILRAAGQHEALAHHTDQVELFTEEVYGVVLRSAGSRGLVFTKWEGHEAIARHLLEEGPGLVWRMCGPARYDWTHGMDVEGDGNEVGGDGGAATASCRVSLTIRWIREDALRRPLRCDQCGRYFGEPGVAPEWEYGNYCEACWAEYEQQRWNPPEEPAADPRGPHG